MFGTEATGCVYVGVRREEASWTERKEQNKARKRVGAPLPVT